MAESPQLSLRLGLLIPCRDEAGVIERKLRNLALVGWPEGGSPHRIVVIDDGCEDDTAERARRCASRLMDQRGETLTASVVSNTERPGKAGAIATGLAALGDTVDLIVLTDADVLLRPDALDALAQCFADAPDLGMACGSQEFVVDLSDDGTLTGREGGALMPAPGRYDRWTAWIRGLESRSGRLFSVHGQLLAWRAELGLSPTPGIAADDIDLMCQTRSLGRAVIKSTRARFVEVKTPTGPHQIAQESRRAQAYFQVMAACRLPPTSSWLDRVHFALYRWLPSLAPRAALAALLLTLATLWWTLGPGPATALVTLTALALLTPPARRALRLLKVIETARRAQQASDLTDRWQMPRQGPTGG